MREALQHVGKYGKKQSIINPYNVWLHTKVLLMKVSTMDVINTYNE